MFTPKKQSEPWREALKFISRCPICGDSYNTEEAQMFGKTDHASLVHLACGRCKSYFVAVILVAGNGLSSVGMVTDLNFEDSKRLHEAEPITLDEAIAGYQLIRDNKIL